MKALCLDIGNTKVKFAIYDSYKLWIEGVQEDILVKDINEWKSNYAFDYVILSSTRILRRSLLNHLTKNYSFINLDHKTPIPIKNSYSTPSTLGRDRIAAAVGAWSRNKTAKHLVIDIGTCITLDVVSDSTFIGGNIAPGVYLRLKSMNDYTDKLPLVDREYHGQLLGKSTEEALQNGAILGTICEIESFIRRTQAVYGEINVTLTGGDGQFFADHIDSEIFVDPYLVLKGLYEILQYNV